MGIMALNTSQNCEDWMKLRISNNSDSVHIESTLTNSGSVQFSHSVVPNSLQPHGLQHARPPCPSLTPGVHSNSCPLSRWCHPTILSPVVRLLLLLPSIFPSIRVFSNESVLCLRWPKIGVSASASVLPMNIQDWFPLGWTCLISFQSKGLSRVFSR